MEQKEKKIDRECDKKSKKDKSAIIINPEMNEALTFQQRMKRSKIMKKYAKKLARNRKIVMKRAASTKTLQKRARKAGLGTVKQKFSGGRKASDLSPGEKAKIEKMAAKKGKLVSAISKRLVKAKRKTDIKRRKSMKESIIEYRDGMRFNDFLIENGLINDKLELKTVLGLYEHFENKNSTGELI